MTTVTQLLVGIIALFVGTFVSLMLSGGIGPCGTDFSLGGTIVAMVVAIVLSSISLVAVPSTRSLGAMMFSVPLSIAFVWLAASRQWLKGLSCLACIMAALATVYFGIKGLSGNKANDV